MPTSTRAKATVGEQARLAYYEWVRARLAVLVAHHQLAQVRATLSQVESLAGVQRVSKADVLRVQSQFAEAKQLVDQLGDAATLREDTLRRLISAKADEQLSIGDDVRGVAVADHPETFEHDDHLALAHRFELRALDDAMTSASDQVAAERAALIPHIAAVGVVDYGDPNPRVFPEADTFRTTWAVGVQATWSLEEALDSIAAARRIRAEQAGLAADRRALRDQIETEVLASRQAFELARRAVETTRDGLVAAEEGYRVRQQLLEVQRASVVEVIDAETELTRARIAALDARVDLRVALARLDHATGAAP